MFAIDEAVSLGQDALPVCLWKENSNRLVSLWEIVNQFKAFEFGRLLNQLATWQCAALREDGGRIVPELTQDTLGTVKELITFCKQVRFNECGQTAFWVRKHLSNRPNVSLVANEMSHLKENLLSEAHGRVFLYVASDASGYVDKRALFGTKVYHAFPSARKDIQEAGNCLAAECFTACVFHLMRAAEYGLRALGQDRQVKLSKGGTLDLATWEELLKTLEDAEEAIRNYPKTLAREAQYEFYHGAMMELKRFKNKFRNRVMHTREEYDRDEARSALTHVRDFMKILAGKISESTATSEIWI